MGIEKKIRKCVQEMSAYPTARAVKYEIGLMSNENNYGPSPKVKKALSEYSEKIFRYPDPEARELRNKLSEYTGVPPENIVAFSGGDDAIRCILGLFVEKNSEVISYSPTFPMYEIGTRFYGGRFITQPLDENFAFTHATAEGMLSKINERTVAIAICNPNNPTGTGVAHGHIERFLDTGLPVILDEAYYEFSGKTLAGRIPDQENLIIIRSLSKAFALAGLRVGYALASKEIANALMKTKLVFNVNGAAQACALAALADIDYMRSTVSQIIKDRERVRTEISRMGYKAYPSEANFLLVKAPFPNLAGHLLAKGILARESLPDCVRITIGKTDENDRLLSSLFEIAEEYGRMKK
ncbi:MAG: histidinol-phosphate transaminase [Candidatus Micrarchaeia archaeon]